MSIQKNRRDFLAASAVAVGSVILPHVGVQAVAPKIEMRERRVIR